MFLFKKKPIAALIIVVILSILYVFCDSPDISADEQFENGSSNNLIYSQGLGQAIGLPDDQADAFNIGSLFLYQYTEKFFGPDIILISEYHTTKVEISDLEKELYTQVTLCDERFTGFLSVEISSDLKKELTYWDLCYHTGKKNELAHVIISKNSYKVVGYIFPWEHEEQLASSIDEK